MMTVNKLSSRHSYNSCTHHTPTMMLSLATTTSAHEYCLAALDAL